MLIISAYCSESLFLKTLTPFSSWRKSHSDGMYFSIYPLLDCPPPINLIHSYISNKNFEKRLLFPSQISEVLKSTLLEGLWQIKLRLLLISINLGRKQMLNQSPLFQQPLIIEQPQLLSQSILTTLSHNIDPKIQELQYPQSLLLSQSTQQEIVCLAEKETSKKVGENKARLKKLKQKLSALSEQAIEQGLLKEEKDLTSPNKSRLMKLALELEKSLKTQAVEYGVVESTLKEIQKIVQHKREHDLLILRGARIICTLAAILRKFPSLHKTQANQSMLALQQSLKLLKVLLSLSSNREYFLVNNHLCLLMSLLSCAIMREQKKLAVSCLGLLGLIIYSSSRIQLQPFIDANIEYLFATSLIKRLKSALQVTVKQDDPSHSQFLLLGLKFHHHVFSYACSKQIQKPIYVKKEPEDGLFKAAISYFQPALLLSAQAIIDLIFEEDCGNYVLRDEEIPTFKINCLLIVLKTINIVFQADLQTSQRTLECTQTFMKSLLFILQYTKQNFKESIETKNLCNQIMVALGNLAFQNPEKQEIIRKSGLLVSLCNHPLDYFMDSSLRHILIPSLCCLLHDNPDNFATAFEDYSAQNILQYLTKEITDRKNRKLDDEFFDPFPAKTGQCHTMSRKTSVSSLTSNYSKASISEYSAQTSPVICGRQSYLQQRFRPSSWDTLVFQLQRFDD